MVNGKEAIVGEFILHHIKTSVRDSVFGDTTELLQSDEEQEFLRKLFLKPFANMAQTAEFTHAVGLEYNVLHGLCNAICAEEDLVERSRDIARHLIDSSQHHNINPGDLFVVKFQQVELGARHHEALGIYKFDDKEVFIESKVKGGAIDLHLRRGLGNAKPNKACLVVFTDEAPTLFVIDDNDHTAYWQNDFIGLRLKKDHVNSTSHFLEMTKSFITEQLPQNYEIAKADQIDLLNRSVLYFKSNAEFDQDNFAKEVFQEEAAIRSFEQYGHEFQREHDVEILPNFEISTHAVKKQARVFKSVIKLDKNFHIYIHGDRNRIEHGVDERGRKFYRIFYDEES